MGRSAMKRRNMPIPASLKKGVLKAALSNFRSPRRLGENKVGNRALAQDATTVSQMEKRVNLKALKRKPAREVPHLDGAAARLHAAKIRDKNQQKIEKRHERAAQQT